MRHETQNPPAAGFSKQPAPAVRLTSQDDSTIEIPIWQRGKLNQVAFAPGG